MGFLKNLKQGLDAARNPPSPEEIQASLQQLTPDQRAAYDANMAQVAAAQRESQQAWEQSKAINDQARILEGPAGRYLYGAAMREFGSPEEITNRAQEVGVWELQKELRAKRKGEFKTVLRQTLNISEVKQEDDAVRREQIAASERAARDAARGPYRAPDAARVAISRLATRGETQLQELTAHLGSSGLAARPESVFGLYRVPDRISQALTPHSEKGRVVEWDIVHLERAAGTGYSTDPAITTFGAGDQWVARRMGEPSILDEDLGIAYLATAGLGPERCLGVARFCEFRALKGEGSEDSSGPIRSIVRGVLAVHPDVGSGAYENLRAQAPLPLPAERGDVVVDAINWGEIAKAVRPKINHPPPVPSPFSYLPSTPQELMRAYIDVVGLQPQDCYSVQATVDHARALEQGGMFTTNLGPKQPCADGKDRMRSIGCQFLLFVYRDCDAYRAGRERWSAYESEVLQARLHKGINLRDRLSSIDGYDNIPRGLRAIAKAAEAWDRFYEGTWGEETVPTYRYCWPPIQ
jgi:hypothetical protein